MNNEILRQTLLRLAEIRGENEREEARRRREVIAACPEIGRVMKERSDSVMRCVASAFTVPPPADLEERVRGWNERIKQLLAKSGFPADYLDPVYTCGKCRDTGYVGAGKKRLCDCAITLASKFAQLAGDAAWADGAAQEQTFENFDEGVFPDDTMPDMGVSQRGYMRLLRGKCEAFANALPAPPRRTVLMTGSSGLGKTYLLRCILARARERDIPALCVTANAFLRTAREAYFGRTPDALDAFYETPLLLVDDLGTEPMLEGVTVEQVFNLINERQNARLCTVFSTNLTLDEVEKRYTERVFSRLVDKREARILRFYGRDVRMMG